MVLPKNTQPSHAVLDTASPFKREITDQARNDKGGNCVLRVEQVHLNSYIKSSINSAE